MEVNKGTITTGLTQEEVKDRIEKGLKNEEKISIAKTKREIIQENVCTLFNLLNLLIAVLLGVVGAWSNMFFILIILANILIGIVQELHAKKLVDDLSLLIAPSVEVLRDDKQIVMDARDLVMDDVMVLDSGKQILCDSIVLDGEVEVNEALLTGETDPIHKKQKDHLLSGSSIISGKCYARVEHIKNDNYATHIANEAKQLRGIHSELLGSMKKVTKITSYIILPLGILLFLEALFLRNDPFFDAIVFSSAGLLGMLPKGLVLLISTSLAIGIARLAKAKVLIQELYALETLAHVDVLCLDKTGTITCGDMQVEDVYTFSTEGMSEVPIEKLISSFFYHSDDNNATFQSLHSYFTVENHFEPLKKIAFSSSRKWSGITFKKHGSILVGAPDKLLSRIPENLQRAMQEGKRVLILAYQQEELDTSLLLANVIPLQAVILQDKIREHAQETFAYFKAEGVALKVISGDHPVSVSAVAKQVGIEGYERIVDMSTLPKDVDLCALVEQNTIFGRVTPMQKKQLVQALQANEHVVAMSGDGVNDILAMKEADCSIAIAKGADAACQVAQVVLMDSDFTSLPQALLEGRRVVNHVRRVAGVFFIKTIYSTLLSILCVLLNVPFPFLPIQITLLDLVIEAFPAFVTMLEPDHKKLQGTFLSSVMQRAFPLALAIMSVVLLLYGICPLMKIAKVDMVTMMYFSVACISMFGVIRSSLPFTPLRLFVCGSMVAGFLIAVLLFHELLHVEPLPMRILLCTAILSLIGFGLSTYLMEAFLRRKSYA